MADLSPGQKELLITYVAPAIDAYFARNIEPNPEDFMEMVAASHPAVQPALGHVLAQLWHASYTAYSSRILKEVKDGTREKAQRAYNNLIQVKAQVSDGIEQSMTDWNLPDDWKKYHRGLTGKQFFEIDNDKMPFWYREQNRMLHAYISEQVGYNKLLRGYASVIQQTNEDPNSIEPPAGYVAIF